MLPPMNGHLLPAQTVDWLLLLLMLAHVVARVCVSTRLSLEHIAADALPLQTFKNSHSKASGSTSTSTTNPKNNDSNRVCSTNGYRQPSSEPLRPFVAAICRIQHLLNAI